jgi:oligoendopeptidase F
MKKYTIVLAVACVWLLAVGSVFAPANESGAIPQRSDIDPQYRWRLEDIYADTVAWERDYALVKEGLPTLETYQGRLTESGGVLLACLQLADSLWNTNDRLFVYSYMKQDEDTRVSAFQALSGRAGALNTEVGQAVSFIRPEILAANEALIRKFTAETPGLEIYSHYLDDILRQRAHTLSPSEEDLLAMTRDFAHGPRDVFTMLDDADIKYGTILDEDGKEVELTKQRYYGFLESTDRRLRREATEDYNNAYFGFVNTLGANLAASIKGDWFFARARGYNTCLEAALDQSNIPADVYENLIAAANKNLAPLHRFVALRKKVLGLDTLRKYDMYVPLVAEAKMDIPYDNAVEDVLQAIKPLGDEYTEIATRGVKGGGWIDVYETAGKTSGGYQWGAYSTHPYILLNYSNTINEEFTLAHELGHAMHHVFTAHNQPFIYGDASTFTAEVASITNELLLMDYLLKTIEDPEAKKYILNYQIEQFVGTFYTQCMFSEFEHTLHLQVEAGEGLSAESMRQTYREIYQKYWGPDLTLTELDDLTGLRIGHFYRNYYVYQYATSIAAAGALADRILNGDKKEVEQYLAFLKAGKSDYPVQLLQEAGVDMTSAEPVNQAVKRFEMLVAEFEKLLN